MKVNEIMKVLQDDIKVAIISTVDEENQPHARPINVGVANEEGVFFMTSPETKFYKQLQANSKVAITAYSEKDYLIQVIRIEGQVRNLGKEGLQEVLKDNPYVDKVYPDADERKHVQVFHLYQGAGFYHSLTQGHKYTFEIGEE